MWFRHVCFMLVFRECIMVRHVFIQLCFKCINNERFCEMIVNGGTGGRLSSKEHEKQRENTEEESVDIITQGEMLKKGIVKPKTDAPHTPKTPKTPRLNKTPKKVKKGSNKEPKPVPNTKDIHPFFSSPQSASSQDLMTMLSAPR